MGWETDFSVFEPKTGAEVYDQVKAFGNKIGSKYGGKDELYWKLANEIWILFKHSLLDGRLVISGRKDGAVCPGIVHGFNCLLDSCFGELTSNYLNDYQYTNYDTAKIFDAHRIGRWAKDCWVLDASDNENFAVQNKGKVSTENYGLIGLGALWVALEWGFWTPDLNNISVFSGEQVDLFLKFDSEKRINLGLHEFPEKFLNLEGFEIVFTKKVMMSLTCAEEILQSKTEQFYFPFGSSNPKANEVLAELRKKQTLELSELKSLKEKMYNHFRERLEEVNRERLEWGDELLTIEELISDEGGDWVEEQRELAVSYIARDALDEVNKLGLSFISEVDLSFVPQTESELTLYDTIKYISESNWDSMHRFETKQLDFAKDYYWQLRKQMDKTGEFRGIKISEYINDSEDLDYNYNSTSDEKFIKSAKAALNEGKLIYFWTE